MGQPLQCAVRHDRATSKSACAVAQGSYNCCMSVAKQQHLAGLLPPVWTLVILVCHIVCSHVMSCARFPTVAGVMGLTAGCICSKCVVLVAGLCECRTVRVAGEGDCLLLLTSPLLARKQPRMNTGAARQRTTENKSRRKTPQNLPRTARHSTHPGPGRVRRVLSRDSKGKRMPL